MRNGDGGEHLAAQPGCDRVARHAQERMRIGRRGRNHHVLLAAEPQDRGGDEHQHAGNAERDRGPEMPQEDRHQQRREERAEVDDPVERVEHHLRAMLVRLVELVADKRGDTRLDAARAERDQPKPDVKTGAVCDEHRQARLARAVDQAEPEDRVVFAEKPVGQPAAEQREKVNADDEGVENVLRAAWRVRLPAGKEAATRRGKRSECSASRKS